MSSLFGQEVYKYTKNIPGASCVGDDCQVEFTKQVLFI